MADRVLSALVKVRIEESGTRADQKLLDDYRLNDEGRNARQAETYSFEERELTDSLTELGLTPGQLRDAHEMGNLMKGYITSTPLPIYKEINGERKPLGEACFYAVREEGRTIVKALPVLKSPQYDMTAYKELFTDRQRKQLAANGHLEGTKVMRDFTTGRECECYVSYHEPTRRLTTLPVDSLRPLTHIYGQPLSRQEQEALRGGRQVEVTDIQRRDGRLISGILRADANHRGFYFKDTETTLRIGERVNGALIDDTQRAKLENHELVYVTGMRRRNGTTYSDDVIFTEGNIQLVGQAARNYKPQQAQRQILEYHSPLVRAVVDQVQCFLADGDDVLGTVLLGDDVYALATGRIVHDVLPAEGEDVADAQAGHTGEERRRLQHGLLARCLGQLVEFFH